jgi:serine/threonine protein kinase
MADVVLAHDAETGRAVAVKVLRLDDDRSLARFRSEIEVLEQLDHPGVVRLLGSGWYDDTRPYLVLELVDGPTLAALLLDGALGEERSVTIGEHLAAALAYAHDRGIVHRDVKPSNVLFEDATQPPRLADFGLARLAETTRVTVTGACVGTAAYVAPEQLEGRAGPAADVYSLGLVLIECLTGALCYSGTMAEVALARLHRSPVVPGHLPTWLRDVLRAMTHREAALRPPAAAVAEAFRARSSGPLPTGTTGTGTAVSKPTPSPCAWTPTPPP